MKKIISLLLSAVFLITIAHGEIHSVEAVDNDISNSVVIEGVNLKVDKGAGAGYEYVVQNGVAVPQAPNIAVGDAVRVEYNWSLPLGTMPVNPGSTFSLALPDSNYIRMGNTAIYPLRDSVTNEKIGEWQVKDGFIVVELNEAGAGKDKIVNGFFTINGRVMQEGEEVTIDSENQLFPPITIDPKPGGNGGENPPPPVETPDYKEIPGITNPYGGLYKNGYQQSNTNTINWNFVVNYNELQNMMENQPVESKNNMILVDKLPEGLELNENSFNVYVPFYLITDSGKLSSKSLVNIQLTNKFTRVNPTSGQTYENFYQQIKSTTTPVIGVYEDTILVGFGNVPGNGITYADAYPGYVGEIDRLLTEGSITANQANLMKQAYGPNSTTNGEVVGYTIAFTTAVPEGTGEYENTGQLIYNNDDTIDVKKTVIFTEINGGAEGGYLPTPVEVPIIGEKILTGDKTSIEDGQFTFTLTEGASNNTNGYSGFNNTTKASADGKINFGDLTFTKEGVYTFIASEVEGTEAGYTYDKHTIDIVITITKNSDNKLETTVVYEKSDGSDAFIFKNTFTTPKIPEVVPKVPEVVPVPKKIITPIVKKVVKTNDTSSILVPSTIALGALIGILKMRKKVV